MKREMKYLVGVLGLCLPATSHATLITFEEFGTQPALFDSANPVNNKYLSYGVQFRGPGGSTVDGGVLLNDSTFTTHAHSGNNFFAFSRIGETDAGGGLPIDPEQLTFTTAVTSVSIFAASVDSSKGGHFTLTAYNSAGAQVDSNSISLAVLQWGQLSVNANSISKVVLTETGNANTFVYDDLNFNPVPESGTMVMMLAGVGLFAMIRKPRG